MPEDLEPIDRGNVSQRTFFGVEIWVRFEQDVGEAQAEVSAIDVEVLLSGHINFLASGAVGLNNEKVKFCTISNQA